MTDTQTKNQNMHGSLVDFGEDISVLEEVVFLFPISHFISSYPEERTSSPTLMALPPQPGKSTI